MHKYSFLHSVLQIYNCPFWYTHLTPIWITTCRMYLGSMRMTTTQCDKHPVYHTESDTSTDLHNYTTQTNWSSQVCQCKQMVPKTTGNPVCFCSSLSVSEHLKIYSSVQNSFSMIPVYQLLVISFCVPKFTKVILFLIALAAISRLVNTWGISFL